jgi:16S rRNA processing protein RimM
VELCVLPGDEPARPPGYWFGHELEGLAAVDRSGRELGRVQGLGEAGGRPLLAVLTPRGLRDVPFCEPIVVSVDPSLGRVVLDPPDGLLD